MPGHAQVTLPSLVARVLELEVAMVSYGHCCWLGSGALQLEDDAVRQQHDYASQAMKLALAELARLEVSLEVLADLEEEALKEPSQEMQTAFLVPQLVLAPESDPRGVSDLPLASAGSLAQETPSSCSRPMTGNLKLQFDAQKIGLPCRCGQSLTMGCKKAPCCHVLAVPSAQRQDFPRRGPSLLNTCCRAY